MSAQWTPGKTQVVIAYAITDAPDIPGKFTKVVLRPLEATVTTVSDGTVSAVVVGRNVKKDGSVGVNWHDRSYRKGSWAPDAFPDWLDAIVAEQQAAHPLGGAS